jgi:hypothetical protein
MKTSQHPFVHELRDLRDLGFAEALELSPQAVPDEALRLECGSMGVAVELRTDRGAGSRYAIMPLVSHDGADTACTGNHWPDIMKSLHSLTRSDDDG